MEPIQRKPSGIKVLFSKKSIFSKKKRYSRTLTTNQLIKQLPPSSEGYSIIKESDFNNDKENNPKNRLPTIARGTCSDLSWLVKDGFDQLAKQEERFNNLPYIKANKDEEFKLDLNFDKNINVINDNNENNDNNDITTTQMKQLPNLPFKDELGQPNFLPPVHIGERIRISIPTIPSPGFNLNLNLNSELETKSRERGLSSPLPFNNNNQQLKNEESKGDVEEALNKLIGRKITLKKIKEDQVLLSASRVESTTLTKSMVPSSIKEDNNNNSNQLKDQSSNKMSTDMRFEKAKINQNNKLNQKNNNKKIPPPLLLQHSTFRLCKIKSPTIVALRSKDAGFNGRLKVVNNNTSSPLNKPTVKNQPSLLINNNNKGKRVSKRSSLARRIKLRNSNTSSNIGVKSSKKTSLASTNTVYSLLDDKDSDEDIILEEFNKSKLIITNPDIIEEEESNNSKQSKNEEVEDVDLINDQEILNDDNELSQITILTETPSPPQHNPSPPEILLNSTTNSLSRSTSNSSSSSTHPCSALINMLPPPPPPSKLNPIKENDTSEDEEELLNWSEKEDEQVNKLLKSPLKLQFKEKEDVLEMNQFNKKLNEKYPHLQQDNLSLSPSPNNSHIINNNVNINSFSSDESEILISNNNERTSLQSKVSILHRSLSQPCLIRSELILDQSILSSNLDDSIIDFNKLHNVLTKDNQLSTFNIIKEENEEEIKENNNSNNNKIDGLILSPDGSLMVQNKQKNEDLNVRLSKLNLTNMDGLSLPKQQQSIILSPQSPLPLSSNKEKEVKNKNLKPDPKVLKQLNNGSIINPKKNNKLLDERINGLSLKEPKIERLRNQLIQPNLSKQPSLPTISKQPKSIPYHHHHFNNNNKMKPIHQQPLYIPKQYQQQSSNTSKPTSKPHLIPKPNSTVIPTRSNTTITNNNKPKNKMIITKKATEKDLEVIGKLVERTELELNKKQKEKTSGFTLKKMLSKFRS